MDKPVPALAFLEGKTVFRVSADGGSLILEWTDGEVTAFHETPKGLVIEHCDHERVTLQ